jgi:hypothetical protein
MKYRKISENVWLVTVQENKKTKEVYIEFPPDAIDQVGWDLGEELQWTIQEDDSVVLTKL